MSPPTVSFHTLWEGNVLSLETEAPPPACLLLGLSPLLWAPGVVLGWGTLNAPFFGRWKGNQDGRCELPDKP